MIFRHPNAVRQLLEHGVVATMRTHRYRPGQRVWVKTPVKCFEGLVAGVLPNTAENRMVLYTLSGFESPEDWLAEARRLHRRHPRYIIIVRASNLQYKEFPELG